MPAVSRPEGGRANGVPFNRMAKTKAKSNPRTKTGMDTPRLANPIVRTSAAELRRTAETMPSRTPTIVAKVSA